MANKHFKLPDTGFKEALPESKYYQWLKDNEIGNVKTLEALRKYLATLGFQIGTDVISREDLELHKLIFSVYWDFEVKNSLTTSMSMEEIMDVYFVRPSELLKVKTKQGTFIFTRKKGAGMQPWDPLTKLAVIENLRVDVLRHQ